MYTPDFGKCYSFSIPNHLKDLQVQEISIVVLSTAVNCIQDEPKWITGRTLWKSFTTVQKVVGLFKQCNKFNF